MRRLYISTLYQLWRFERANEPGRLHDGYDALYIPQVGYITGDIDIHDLAVDGDGELVFVNTLFSCLATTSETHSFKSLWQPPFITRLAAEDRCHLNGLAMENGRPRYVTSVSQADVNDGWRDKRVDGGVVIDVTTNEIVADGLSMPHSPRLYRDKLWLLNSGTGEFGTVDRDKGRFEPVAFCPGYLRGLAFCGDFAIVGLSESRHNKTFDDLPLKDRLAAVPSVPVGTPAFTRNSAAPRVFPAVAASAAKMVKSRWIKSRWIKSPAPAPGLSNARILSMLLAPRAVSNRNTSAPEPPSRV